MTAEAISILLERRAGLRVEHALALRLAAYLELLLRWNAKTNLSAIREPEAIVLRHFGESLACARDLPAGVRTLLDYGSGGGFPGALCALARPEIAVVLAESQNKKAAFLQELCRVLGLSARVHAGRVEALPASARFEAVTLRAVDKMQDACVEAQQRVEVGGWLVLMTTEGALAETAPRLEGLAWRPAVSIVGSERGVVAMGRVLRGKRSDVPRGTSG